MNKEMKMEAAKNQELDKNLNDEVFGYNGKKYTLYELRCSANNYLTSDPKECRQKLKEKYAKVYNCIEQEVPPSILKEVYSLDSNFKEICEPVSGYTKNDYYASNLGRIRQFGKIMLQDDTNLNGYLYLKDYAEGSNKLYKFKSTTPVYTFIACAFFKDFNNGTELKHIHHINNNGYDSRPDNLIPLTQKEHSIAHGRVIKNSKEA